MKKLIIIFIILASTSFVAAQKELSFIQLQKAHGTLNNRDPKEILPQELGDYNKEKVSIQGYVFKSPGGEWILASRPDIKSCCIGSEREVFNQVYLECKTDPTFHNQQVKAEGNFNVEVLENGDGKLVRVYSLKDAKVQKVQHKKIPVVTICILAALVFLFIIGKRFKRASS